MKYIFAMLFIIFSILVGEPANIETLVSEGSNTKITIDKTINAMSTKISVKIGDRVFIASLSDNVTATAFKALLPITMKMTELNGNEKYADLAGSLPTNASRPSSIQAGDLLLFGSRTVVLFYQTFSTTYSYTKLGRVDDPAGLAAALGLRNVTITFAMQ